MPGRLATVGVYGFTAETYLAALEAAGVTKVLDIRQRRGVRGARYAWANAQRLQRLLAGARIAYIDTLASLPGMVELIEFTPAQHRRYTAMYAAAVGWDGSDPVRRAAAEAGS